MDRSTSLRILVIDNYDSYTFNLVQYLAQLNEGRWPLVLKNDDSRATNLQDFCDCIVLSPGPGVPHNPSDFGVCWDLLKSAQVPLLGVCLGHQGLGEVYGAKLSHAPEVAHGKISVVKCSGGRDSLFEGVPERFKVVRYHSWVIDLKSLPECFESTAVTDDVGECLLMAMRHRTKPFHSLQFHPESIATEYGMQLIKNFLNISLRFQGEHHKRRKVSSSASSYSENPFDALEQSQKLSNSIRLAPAEDYHYRIISKKSTLSVSFSAEKFISALNSSAPSRDSCLFWLDSSRVEEELSRFSFLGISSEAIFYDLPSRTVTTVSPSGKKLKHLINKETFFDFSRAEMEKRKVSPSSYSCLPFDFVGGFVGYFGYELKAESECSGQGREKNQWNSSEPDAALLLVERFIAIDHLMNEMHMVYLLPISRSNENEAQDWFESMTSLLSSCEKSEPQPSHSTSSTANLFELQRSQTMYRDDIRECLRQIQLGESYELCLTNKVIISHHIDPLPFYFALRKRNPAPYAAFLRFFEEFSVACSSPERFLKLDARGKMESKPIKGTTRRGATKEEDDRLRTELATSSKAFSENLMIVDLIRNDFGRVCVSGSVQVPKLMNVESYTTVHQLVTTITGQLLPGLYVTEALRNCFPPGSMTGAPKVRSVEILDRLEGSARGVYSGALGFLSFSGACDLAVVIRTAVMHKNFTYIGTGGAIVAASDIEEEFDEIQLKANALVRTVVSLQTPVAPSQEHLVNASSSRHCPFPRRTTEVLRSSSPSVPFSLLETILYDGDHGFFLLEEHLNRMQSAAKHFQFDLDIDSVRRHLESFSTKSGNKLRVRVCVDQSGQAIVQSTELTDLPHPYLLRLSPLPIDSADEFVRFKTTHRHVYDRARALTDSSAHDVILWNERGFVTESLIGNIAIKRHRFSEWITPPLSCGLLGGVMRQKLLDEGKLITRAFTVNELLSAQKILLFNSVRKEWKGVILKEQ